MPEVVHITASVLILSVEFLPFLRHLHGDQLTGILHNKLSPIKLAGGHNASTLALKHVNLQSLFLMIKYCLLQTLLFLLKNRLLRFPNTPPDREELGYSCLRHIVAIVTRCSHKVETSFGLLGSNC